MKIYYCCSCNHRIGCETKEQGFLRCMDCVMRGFCFKKSKTSKEVDKSMMCPYCKDYVKNIPFSN